MKIENLENLFEAQLHDVYYAEKQITKALPKMAKKATSPKLKQGFEKHLEETEDQIAKLEKVMKSLNIKIKGEKCEAIEGLLKEGEELMKDAKDDETRDAALICAAQKVEHYEIATYGCLCAFAKRLGYNDEAKILHSILEQERKTDETLTKLAEGPANINKKAAA